ncbi:MAG TPA: hypothetical protein VGO33_13525 [Gemmatimonadaceae bacterium]|jgi:hypothetical protein|nr:hypothetical protein [Gemmatimonadaceae bacterium]
MNFTSKSLATLCALSAMTACGSDTSVGPGTGGGTNGPKAAVLTGNIASDKTLSKDTVYTLSGFVKVRSGATIHIPAGTTIVGDTLVNGSSLWILPGGKIDAVGTAASPIVFTSARTVGNRKPGDWGGIIIVGKAIANRGCPNAANASCVATTLTEGPAGGVQNTAENYAGGTDPNDNSGTMQYVRVEFAGYAVQLDQELNSFSLYAVGRGTKLEYLESMSGLDDSFEWFGGSVDGRYFVSYESGDDHFDWTEGYNGRNQFMIGYQTYKPTPLAGAGFASSDPRGFEGDGCETTKAGCADFTTQPYSEPVFANFTLVGPGPGVFTGVSDANGSVIRRGSGGTIFNGILARWQGIGLDVRDAQTNTLRTLDSLIVTNVLFTENGGGNFDPAGTNFGQLTNFPANEDGTMSTTGLFVGIPAAGTNPTGTTLDWSLSASSAARAGGLTALPTRVSARVQSYFGGTIAGTAYRGASDPAGAKWWAGWTNYARN